MSQPVAHALAEHIRAQSKKLVKRWLAEIQRLASVDAKEVFPGHDLIDHIPLLVQSIAGYVEDPDIEITVDAPVMAKAIELGRLRYEQGFDARQILKEYEILGHVLFDDLVDKVDEIEEPASRRDLLICAWRLFSAISTIQQHTTSAFLSLDEQRVQEREQRLRAFNHMVSHELTDRVSAAVGASDLLREERLARDPAERERFVSMIQQNLESLQRTLENLRELSSTQQRDTVGDALLSDILNRVTDELEGFTRERHVRVDVDDLPAVRVPGAAVELALSNLMINAAKYRDASRSDPWIKVSARQDDGPGGCRVTVRVEDNGLGVPEHARDQLFHRFFRAHEDEVAEQGSGMGLAIARETLESFHGHIWAEFPNQGSVFAFTIPCEPASSNNHSNIQHGAR